MILPILACLLLLIVCLVFIPKERKGLCTGVYLAKYDSVNVNGVYYILPNDRTAKRMFEIQDKDIVVGEIVDNYFYPIHKA